MRTERFDKIVIGAGLYGLYAALSCSKRNQKILVLEADPAPFMRATYINQARVHQGYHYPRSISTALKSAGYFERFNRDYDFCINRAFDQIYATSANYSWSDGKQFRDFCKAAGIPCEELNPDSYFKKGMCDGAFRTREYTYDAMILKEYMLEKLSEQGDRVKILYDVKICRIEKDEGTFTIQTEDGNKYESGYVLNAAYAGTNQILEMAGLEQFQIKYELCEITLCTTNEDLKEVGFTIMDGPFFSIMPFGKTGYHSLTLSPLLENIIMKQHAVSYTYDRMKLALPLLITVYWCIKQLGFRRSKIGCTIIIAIAVLFSIQYKSDSSYVWSINYKQANQQLCSYINENYDDSVCGLNTSVRGYMNLSIGRGVVEGVTEVEQLEPRAESEGNQYIVLFRSVGDHGKDAWNMYKLEADVFDRVSGEKLTIENLNNGIEVQTY